jgi:glucose/arabinose dehydrogenase
MKNLTFVLMSISLACAACSGSDDKSTSSDDTGSSAARARTNDASAGTRSADTSGAGQGGADYADTTTTVSTRCSVNTPNPARTLSCPTGDPTHIQATLLYSGFDVLTNMATAPGDTSRRLFVVERSGAIKVIKDGNVLPTPFLETTVATSSTKDDERGLLGFAFDPNYSSNGRFYIHYTRSGNGGLLTSYVDAFHVSATDPDRADPDSRSQVLEYPGAEDNHNGGELAFGPDGCLYIGTGDGGGADDQHGTIGYSQDLTTPLGKILRLDVDNLEGTAPGMPSLPGAYKHIWDYGLRNAWRFSFDRDTGDLYIGDVGQMTWEEINVEAKGEGGKNYGWRPTEGKHCRGSKDDIVNSRCPEPGAPGGEVDVSGYTWPIFDYAHSDGANAVIAGFVYRGSKIPDLQGYYLFGDLGWSNSKVWALGWRGGSDLCYAPIEVSWALSITGNITSFAQDADGELYILTTAGNIYRIDPS